MAKQPRPAPELTRAQGRPKKAPSKTRPPIFKPSKAQEPAPGTVGLAAKAAAIGLRVLADLEQRRAYEPTDADRHFVRLLAGTQVLFVDIATLCGLQLSQLESKFKNELQVGRIEMNAAVQGRVYRRALRDSDSYTSQRAAEFILTHKGGWVKAIEHGQDGKDDEFTVRGGLPVRDDDPPDNPLQQDDDEDGAATDEQGGDPGTPPPDA
ncbi:MAG: hypothetical protein ACEQSH_00015 [Bacteroidia bacterium]